jgi:hypothetical protein
MRAERTMSEAVHSAVQAQCPIRLGRADEFARVRQSLRAIGFEEGTINQVLPLDEQGRFDPARWEQVKLTSVPASLRLLIEVFVRGEAIPEREFRAHCDKDTYAAFQSLGLIRPKIHDSDMLVSPVWLYPMHGFVVVSDRYEDLTAIPSSRQRTRFIPASIRIQPVFCNFSRTRAVDALDLCGGCGIGALRLSRTARCAVSADVTQRSAFFTDFNGRLNGAAITSLCGDLYEPVHGREFDVISAHPPFVPAVGNRRLVFRDAEEFGEEITRRIITGLPTHLRAGGTCVIVCAARDTDKPFEQRAFDWLGDGHDSFDVIFGEYNVLSIESVMESIQNHSPQVGQAEVAQLSAQITRRAPAIRLQDLMIRRRSGLRRRCGVSHDAQADAADLVRADAQFSQQKDFMQWLATSKPRFAPQTELTVRHVARDGALAEAEHTFRANANLRLAIRPDPWMVPLVAGLNGRRSVEEVFAAAQSAGVTPHGFTLEAFGELVSLMVERTFLEVELPGWRDQAA